MTWASSDNRGWRQDKHHAEQVVFDRVRCNEFFNTGTSVRKMSSAQFFAVAISHSEGFSGTQRNFHTSNVRQKASRANRACAPSFRGRDHFSRLAPTREAVKAVRDRSHEPAVAACLPCLDDLARCIDLAEFTAGANLKCSLHLVSLG
jgi:hypothetical protein